MPILDEVSASRKSEHAKFILILYLLKKAKIHSIKHDIKKNCFVTKKYGCACLFCEHETSWYELLIMYNNPKFVKINLWFKFKRHEWWLIKYLSKNTLLIKFYYWFKIFEYVFKQDWIIKQHLISPKINKLVFFAWIFSKITD